MILGIFGKCKDIFKETLNKLKGSDRRVALAMVSELIMLLIGHKIFLKRQYQLAYLHKEIKYDPMVKRRIIIEPCKITRTLTNLNPKYSPPI